MMMAFFAHPPIFFVLFLTARLRMLVGGGRECWGTRHWDRPWPRARHRPIGYQARRTGVAAWSRKARQDVKEWGLSSLRISTGRAGAGPVSGCEVITPTRGSPGGSVMPLSSLVSSKTPAKTLGEPQTTRSDWAGTSSDA